MKYHTARMVNGNVPLPHGGGAMGSARPGMSPSLLRRFASSPKLTQPIVASKHPFNRSAPSSAAVPKSSKASTQSFGKVYAGTAKLSSVSAATGRFFDDRQKAELYGTLPKRKVQSQSSKPGRELPKTPTQKKSLPKVNAVEKKESTAKSDNKKESSKKISHASLQSDTDQQQGLQNDSNDTKRSRGPSVENADQDRTLGSSRKTSAIQNLDEVLLPGSLTQEGDRAPKSHSRATSSVGNMERDSLSPDPKGIYQFHADRDKVVNHTGKVFEHMDIVHHGYNAFFSIQKTSPFDIPPPKHLKDENFNNIQAEAEKIVDSLGNAKDITPSVVEENRKGQSRSPSVADTSNIQRQSRSVAVAESTRQGKNRNPSTMDNCGQNQSNATSVVENRRSQTPQRNNSQISESNNNTLRKTSQSPTGSRRSNMSPMRSQGDQRRCGTPSSQRFISPSRSVEHQEEYEKPVIRGTDVDYVSANADLVEQAGHLRRKASRERKESESRSSKLSGLVEPVPQDHEVGNVPRYLQERREKWKKEAEEAEKVRKESAGCPPGHRKLSESERLVALQKMKNEYKNICAEMARFPIRSDTLRTRQRRIELEKDLVGLEDGMKTYEKEKVYILKEHETTIEDNLAVEKEDSQPTLA